MTLAETLHDATARLRAGEIEDARLEAEVLLAHALHIGREAVLARLRESLRMNERAAFETLLARRLAREPSGYIVGHREFYGIDLQCTPAAIIPRPETELLVEHAIGFVRRKRRKHGRGAVGGSRTVVIADVGTGNGAIAVALAHQLQEARVIAVDRSRPALELARRNAAAHGVAGRVDLIQGTLLESLRVRFDLIVANLPYVPTVAYRKLPPEIRAHEPQEALRAGRRGTEIIEELLAQAPRCLRQGGLLLVEHAWNQGRRLRDAARVAFQSAHVETKRDLAGLDRMLIVEATKQRRTATT